MAFGTPLLLDFLRQKSSSVEPEEQAPEVIEQEATRIALEIKRRRKRQMLAQMLRDSGYGELTKMSTPRERKVTYDSREV